MLPDTPRGRLYWAIEEAFVILGIPVFWVAAIAPLLPLTLLTLPFQLPGLRLFEPLVRLARSGEQLWATIMPLTILTASLYVLVRGGSLLVDQYFERR